MDLNASAVADVIVSTDLFDFLAPDDPATRFLADRFRTVELGAESVVLEEGEVGDTLVLLVRGRVRIVKKTPAGEDYTVSTVDDSAHSCLGEMALLDSDVRSATVITECDCVTLELDRTAFEDFAREFPDRGVTAYRRLGRMVARRLRRANDDILTLFEALVQEIEAASIDGPGSPRPKATESR